MTWGGSRWGGTPINVAGIATSANAMSAVKKLVFEEKKYDFKEINDALNENFTSDNGREIQKDLLSAPKYGNDDEFADRVMVELLNMFFKEIEKHKDIDGRNYSTFTVTLGGTVPQGWKTGATADGRKSGMPVSDSFSPANEGLNESPTTVLLSAGKVDQSHFCQGNILNLKFSESALASREAKRKLMDMVSVYFNKLGGQEIQFNVVNAATLKDAQANPENYKDLIIRVAGYSARFIELARDLQNDIIARTEHEGI